MKTKLTRREAGKLVGATLTGALAPGAARAQGKQIVIGGLYPLSGANAQIGVDAKHAYETALDVINNKHDLDLTGNGLNHPNDFGHRLYAQTILALLKP